MSSQAQQAREDFGARLRELRKDARLTGRALADLAGWRLPKVSKIEHGRQNTSEDDIRTWCRVCRAENQLPDLIATARNIEAMWLEWRRILQTGAERRQRASITMYRKTTQVRTYHPTLVAGMLQTAEYASEALRRMMDFCEIPGDDADEAVAARMERQQFLYRGDRRFHVILGEQALYTNVGGPGVMRGQLDRLLAAMSLPRLSLGIIPMKAVYHVWPITSFDIFDDRKVMIETYSAEITVTQPREIALYAKAFALLQQSAVYGQRVRALIGKALSTVDQ